MIWKAANRDYSFKQTCFGNQSDWLEIENSKLKSRLSFVEQQASDQVLLYLGETKQFLQLNSTMALYGFHKNNLTHVMSIGEWTQLN